MEELLPFILTQLLMSAEMIAPGNFQEDLPLGLVVVFQLRTSNLEYLPNMSLTRLNTFSPNWPILEKYLQGEREIEDHVLGEMCGCRAGGGVIPPPQEIIPPVTETRKV